MPRSPSDATNRRRRRLVILSDAKDDGEERLLT